MATTWLRAFALGGFILAGAACGGSQQSPDGNNPASQPTQQPDEAPPAPDEEQPTETNPGQEQGAEE